VTPSLYLASLRKSWDASITTSLRDIPFNPIDDGDGGTPIDDGDGGIIGDGDGGTPIDDGDGGIIGDGDSGTPIDDGDGGLIGDGDGGTPIDDGDGGIISDNDGGSDTDDSDTDSVQASAQILEQQTRQSRQQNLCQRLQENSQTLTEDEQLEAEECKELKLLQRQNSDPSLLRIELQLPLETDTVPDTSSVPRPSPAELFTEGM